MRFRDHFSSKSGRKTRPLGVVGRFLDVIHSFHFPLLLLTHSGLTLASAIRPVHTGRGGVWSMTIIASLHGELWMQFVYFQ